MLAQEAIERIEKRIVWLKNKLGRLNGIVTHSEEINEIKNEIEALSIVLESAKYLHDDILEPSQQEEWRGKSGKRLSILYDIPEERIEIMADDLAKIGIKEGAD